MRVAVIFGGRSPEHEVSVASATSVVGALRSRHEVCCVYVDRAGVWYWVDSPEATKSASDRLGLLSIGSRPQLALTGPSDPCLLREVLHVDVAFPLIHGPYGEDGRLQGLLEMAGLPYVGCDVTSSAIAMDKAVAKAVFAAAGLPQVPYRLVWLRDWKRDRNAIVQKLAEELGLPCFVKPANLGSSVGVSRAEDMVSLHKALDLAFQYDKKAVVEKALLCRELECGILGHRKLRSSVVGEVRPRGPFYDYESKYSAGGSQLLIPAPIPSEVSTRIKELATESFLAIGGSGMARVDFFLEVDTGEVYINEINTIPGFTVTSMYPKLFEASGVPYADLLDQLIGAAIERHDEVRG